MSRIYLSYRRTDAAAYAGRLFDHLTRRFGRGFVFMDIQGGIARGQDFTQAIDAALNTCDVALVLIGKHWATSTGPDGNRRLDDPNDWVRVETAAVLRRNVLVIPVLVDGARLPDPASLPDELRPLCRRHVCELTDPRWSFDVGELVKDIEKIVHPPEPSILTWIFGKLSFYVNERKLLYLRNKRWHWKVGVVIALAVLLGIGFFVSGQKERNIVVLPSRPTGFAKEPNDGIYDATPILFGSSIKSKITKRDPIDWYVFKTPDDIGDEFLVIYRHIEGSIGYVEIEVYDSNEKKIANASSYRESKSLTVKGDKEVTYYVKVYSRDIDAANYELAIRNKITNAAG